MKPLPIILAVTLRFSRCDAFVVQSKLKVGLATPALTRDYKAFFPLFSLPSVDNMRVSEIRQELESYGISTSVFLEKKEMVEALNRARSEGRIPINEDKSMESAGEEMSRDERIKIEMEKASKMRIGDLRKELEALGVSTKSFFEKTEFVKAYAEALVDGVKSATVNNARSKSSASTNEQFDPSYRDVIMQKFDRRDPRLAQSKVIDVRLSK